LSSRIRPDERSRLGNSAWFPISLQSSSLPKNPKDIKPNLPQSH
jgi:hypothetical protein